MGVNSSTNFLFILCIVFNKTMRDYLTSKYFHLGWGLGRGKLCLVDNNRW